MSKWSFENNRKYCLTVKSSVLGKKPQLKFSFLGLRGVYQLSVIVVIKSEDGAFIPLKMGDVEFNYTSTVVLNGLPHRMRITVTDICKWYIDTLILCDKSCYYMVSLVKNTDDYTRPFIITGSLHCGSVMRLKGSIKKLPLQ